MPYAVRTAEPHAAARDVIALLTRNLGASCKDPARRVAWFYLEGPFGPGVAHLLEHRAEASAAGDAAEPVGCMGLGVRRYWRQGAPFDVALLGDLAVDQQHRSLGPAMMLQRATRAYAQTHFPLSLAYPNAKARPVVLRLGFRELGGMRRYVMPLRFSAHVRRRWPAPVARAAGLVFDGAVRLLSHGRRARGGRLHRLGESPEPDPRLDRLSEEARALFPMTGVRTAAFLRWRFLCRPARADCRFYHLLGRESSALEAYAIVDLEGRTAHLRDLFGRDPEAIGALLDLLLPRLRGAGAAAASFSFLGPSWLDALLRRRGFVARESRSVVIDWSTAPPDTPENLLDTERWYLTEADEDA